MLTFVLIAVVAVAALLVYAATRPGAFRLERSTVIAAPAEKVFALIAKLMQTFISMDKMVGGQFEQGLAQIKAAAEK